MAAVPLFTHRTPADLIAWRAGRAVTALEFLRDVHGLIRRLPACSHVLNACEDRYRFAVTLAAGLVDRRTLLLPPARTPELIRQIAAFAPDTICVTDDAHSDIDLPKILQRDEDRATAVDWAVPSIDEEQLAAVVFTSGSTGTPLPHRKTWGRLCACVRAGAVRLGLAADRVHTLVATVPPQHMYGFESTVLLALQSGNALLAERPFYPADVIAALEAAPHPRVLISTPVHLRALLAAEVGRPALDLIVSATSALDAEFARRLEQHFSAPLIEIYGSTETGQIATRRTAESERFCLWPGIRLSAGDEHTFADGGHLEQRTALSDFVQIVGEGEFLLQGRVHDLVNVAGKRSSLGYLSHQLNSIPGVVDGAFFHGEEPSHRQTGVARLAAAVVAPSLDPATLLERLRERIDPAFLPRPLLFVDRLPRNAAGKLPRDALRALCAHVP